MSAGEIFFVRAAGHRLRGLRLGRWTGTTPVLVLLHEGLGSIPQWRDFPEALCRRCGLPGLVYERYGHGGSDPIHGPRPPDFLEREALEALPDVLAACGIERPVLVGHSDGGTIALLYASAFPERPVACIAEAAHVLLEPATRSGVRAVLERWIGDADFRRRLTRFHGDGAEAMLRGWTQFWMAEERRNWSIVDRLGSIRCPVLAIQGERDDHGTRVHADEIVARVCGPAEALILPNCGHVPHYEARAAVLEHIRAFVRTEVGRLAS